MIDNCGSLRSCAPLAPALECIYLHNMPVLITLCDWPKHSEVPLFAVAYRTEQFAKILIIVASLLSTV